VVTGYAINAGKGKKKQLPLIPEKEKVPMEDVDEAKDVQKLLLKAQVLSACKHNLW
jgi:hypothetical protein